MDSKGKIFSLHVLSGIGAMFVFIYISYSCEKIEPERINKLITGSVTNVNYNSCLASGTILDIGNNGIDQHGFCWSTSQYPTPSNFKTQLGSQSSTGIFSCDINGLAAETKYYIRAYTQSDGVISYGNEKSFTTKEMAVIPSLNTYSIAVFSETSATVGGNVTADGGDPVSERGVYYSTSPGADRTGTKLAIGDGTGVFSASITGLTPGTIYYVRAYAINNIGANYGDELIFYTINIGTAFQGGTVVHIAAPGDPDFIKGETHGLIVAPSNQGTLVEWGCTGKLISGADGTAIGSGSQNTLDILAGCSTSGIAAKLCSDLVIGAYSDWYLPSADELDILYDKKAIIGGSLNYTFWCSTEVNLDFAMGRNFIDGGGTSARKSDPFAVRAVRAF